MSIGLLSVLLGAATGLVFWQLYRVFNVVPDEDRSFLDRPPLGFRVVWPLIQVLVHNVGERFSPTQIQGAGSRLKQAGMDFSVSPEQFIAAKYISALGFFLFAMLMLSMIGRSAFLLAIVFGAAGFFYPELWLKEAGEKRRAKILRDLPFYLDIITLSVEAGTNLTGGLTQAVQKSGDGPLRSELSRVLRDIRAGKTRSDSLRDMASRSGSTALQNIISGMNQAERSGSSLGPILRAQADHLRSERFLRAEKKATEAPVKLLGPLVMFIFPTTFLVLGFLVMSKAIQEQVINWGPLVWAYTWPG